MNKVLIVTSHFSPNVGGVETHLNDLVNALIKRKWEVFVSCYKPLARDVKVPAVEKKKGLTVYRMPWVGFNIVHLLTPYPPLEFIYLFPGLFLITAFTILREPDVSVLHAQGLVPTVVALIIGKLTKRKVISSTHNLYFFPKKGLYTRFAKFIFNSCEKVLTLSYASSNELKRIGVEHSKIKQFRYWLDLRLFKPVKTRFVPKELKGKFVVFFIGRLIETKGVKILLEASKKIKDKSIVFVFAGLGPLQDEVKRAERNGNVKYLGRLDPNDVKEQMNLADVVCVPSTVDEGYGRVAMEAISSGAPVLASNVGGLDEVVDNKVGWVVKPTVEAFSKKLSELSRNKKEIEKKRKNTRAYALKNFSERNVEEIIKTYEG